MIGPVSTLRLTILCYTAGDPGGGREEGVHESEGGRRHYVRLPGLHADPLPTDALNHLRRAQLHHHISSSDGTPELFVE